MSSPITLRMATEADAPALLDIYRPYVENTAITFEYDVPSAEEFAERIRHTLKRYPYLVAQRAGEIIGYAYVSPFKERAAYGWAVETSVYVRRGLTGTGCGKALYMALERILKAQNILNLNACIAYASHEDAHLDNNSAEFHAHLGYELVGTFHQCGYKFGTWYDMIWMEKMLGRHPDKPQAIHPIGEIDCTDLL